MAGGRARPPVEIAPRSLALFIRTVYRSRLSESIARGLAGTASLIVTFRSQMQILQVVIELPPLRQGDTGRRLP